MRELPKGWDYAGLPDLISIDGVFVDGDWIESKDQDQNGGVRLIQLADIGDGKYLDKSKRFLTQAKAIELGCTLLQRGDVLIARMPDPLGRACIFPGDSKEAVTVVDVCVVRGKLEHFDPSWLMHFINSPSFRGDVHSLQSGSTRKRISRGNLSALKLPIPPRVEQTRIVAKLEELFSDLDAGVAELKVAQKKLTQYRQSLLKAAVEGALTAEWRQHNHPTETGAQLLERILTERRTRWEARQLAKFAEQGKTPPKDWQKKYPEPVRPDTADLPELPEGWVWASVDQLASIGTGVTPLRSKAIFFEGGEVPWVTSGALNHEFVSVASDLVTSTALKECRLDLYPIGTLLVAMYGEGKTRGKCSELAIPATINQAIAAIVLEGYALECKAHLKSFLLKSYEDMRKHASGGVQPNLNLQIIKTVAVPLPPAKEQRSIQSLLSVHLEAAREQQAAIETALKQSTAQRQNILRAAFSGQLVPQDPDDEPATVLLERIRAERATQRGTPTRRGRKKETA